MIAQSANVDDVKLRSDAECLNRIHIWHHANIEQNVTIGDDTVVGSNVFIGKGARIGIGVHIQHGAFICRGAFIGNRVFIGPGAKLLDDAYPKAGESYIPTPPFLRNYCSIGAGAIIMPGVSVGVGATVGAGAVVMQDVRAYSTVSGVPASLHADKVNKENDSDQDQDDKSTVIHVHGVSVLVKIRKEERHGCDKKDATDF